MALCFAVLFGENAAAGSVAPTSAAAAAGAAAGGGNSSTAEGGKREKLQSRLLGAMEVSFFCLPSVGCWENDELLL